MQSALHKFATLLHGVWSLCSSVSMMKALLLHARDLSLMGTSFFVATGFLIAVALGSTIICDQIDGKP